MSESAATWQEIHKAKPWGRWPPESIVSYFCGRWAPTERRMVRVLDLGCGAGACTRFLVDEGFSVTAIDCSEEALTRMRYNLQRWDLPKVDWHRHDISTGLPFSDASFDVVLDNLTLCHVEPSVRMNVSKHIGRILIPGGTFITRRFNGNCKEIEGRGYVDYRSSCVPDEIRAITNSATPAGEIWEESCAGIHITATVMQKCA